MKPDIQKLKHGKLITKVTTPTFVETWNYITDKVENLKGDADIGDYGYINVDNDNPEAPVIRLKTNKLKNDLGIKDTTTYVDSQISNLQLSSLEYKTFEISNEISDEQTGEVISVDVYNVSVYQIFDFDDKDNTVEYPILSDYNMICRWKDPETEQMIVRYLPLSSLSNEVCDTEISTLRQKSIEHQIKDGKEFLQLHDFDKVDKKVALNIDSSDGYIKYDDNVSEILFRNHTNDNELMYGTLNLSGLSSEMSTIVSCIINNDISNFNNVSNYISTIVENNISNFNNVSNYISTIVENNISNFNNVSNYISTIVENNISNFNNTTNYISNIISTMTSAFTCISGDVNVISPQKSIELKEDGDKRWYQLHKFNDGDYKSSYSQTIDFYDKPIGGCVGLEFLVRKWNGDIPYLGYETLSVKQSHEPVDGEVTINSSIEYLGCNYGLQLNGFNGGNVLHGFNPKQLNDSEVEFKNDSLVMRKWNGFDNSHSIQYVGFDCISAFADYKGDSQLNLQSHKPYQKSIQRNFDDEYGWYYQLFGWCGGSHNLHKIEPHFDGCTYDIGDNIKYDTEEFKDEQWYFLCQHEKANGERTLEYRRLLIQFPKLPEDYATKNDVQNVINNFDDYWTIKECTEVISEISCQLSSQIDQLSGKYWVQGGNAENCYGAQIGDSNKTTVIDLDNRSLNGGSWYCDNFLYVNGDITAVNFQTWNTDGRFQAGQSYFSESVLYQYGNAIIEGETTTTDLIVNGMASTNQFSVWQSFDVNCTSTFNGCITVNNGTITVFNGTIHVEGDKGITIGCITLTEEKLNKLLSLVEGCATAVDKVNEL